tara:strand:+ start:2023 stop:3378 length:1356 start_codon:yes stop_codon:yes gene_type:complete
MSDTQSQFSILSASILLSTPSGSDRVIDVRENVIEVQFFENLDSPYIDARIVLLDDFGLLTALGIQGTERIQLLIGDAVNSAKPIIEKVFFFAQVNESKKINERSEMLSIELVEEHVYVDAVKQFSRSYTDNLENIIENICSKDLGRNVSRDKFTGSVQGTRRVIVPYLSPLEAIEWLKGRATTKLGAPIFLYSSLYDNNLIMSDLDNLLREDVINDKLPLRYAKALQGSEDSLRPYYEVISYRSMSNSNTLDIYQDGSIGSLYANLDAGTGNSVNSHVSIRTTLDEFYTNELIRQSSTQSIFDPSLLIDGKLSDEYNSASIFQVTSSGTYNQFNSVHDEATFINDNNEVDESRLKVKNKNILRIMEKSVIDIGMSSNFFFQGKVSVGNKVRLLILSSDTGQDNAPNASQIDTTTSGDYLIMAINHKLVNENAVAQVRLSKLGDLPSDFAL